MQSPDITATKAIEKRWVVNEAPEEIAAELQAALNIHPILAKLLAQRGISTFEEARHFFRPVLNDLHDPFLMKDMDKAVERLESALKNGEKILIYGDYDVDGTTAVALMYSFLKDFYPDHIDYYIPDRYTEGYGISTQGIDFAAETGRTLIIALDCGIRSVDKVAYATSKGIDFIICDHHLPGDELPAAVAVLDPKREDCTYPYNELSGCGIGYKLIQAFAGRNNIPQELVERQLDLLVVSIASDIVPITGENRILAYYGLALINRLPRKGLASLIKNAGVEGRNLSISDLVFFLGPRINAAGRMDHGKNAVNLLICETDEHAQQSADTLQDNNTNRKLVDKDITDEALSLIRGDEAMLNRKTTVLCQPHWSKGVIGIVASRLIEVYYRPTIILTEKDGVLSGSARSVRGFNVYDAIDACSDLLIQFGGHKYAAGLTMQKENFEAFSSKFEEIVAATISETSLMPEVNIDAELDICDITSKFYRILKQLAPFGPGNMRPVFVTRNCRLKRPLRIVGENHLKMTITQDNNHSCDAIAFGMGHMGEELSRLTQSETFDMVYNLEENEWQGNTSIQVNIKDIRINSTGAQTISA
jgi:single-stranded-DNA-specific exonuclease